MGRIIKGLRKFWSVTNVFITLLVVIVLLAYTCVKTYHVVLFKYVQFIVCQLYFSKAVIKRNKRPHLQAACVSVRKDGSKHLEQ